MSNIDKFDILVGKILAKLYSEFSMKRELVPENFGIENSMAEFLSTIGNDLGDTKELEFMEATVSWLLENGIITAKSSGFGSYYNARLTMKGLNLLKATPKSVDIANEKLLERA